MTDYQTRVREAEARVGQLRDNNRRDVCVQGLFGFIWSPNPGVCFHCGEPCQWVDIAFEGTLHPGRCSEAKWDEYQWAETMAVTNRALDLIRDGRSIEDAFRGAARFE